MNESQRQVYLSALALEQYVPRWILPGAAISPACDLPQEAVVERNVERNVKKNVEKNVEKIVERTVERTVEKIIPEKINKVLSKPTNTPNFTLNIWRIGDDLLIVDSHVEKQALPTDRLLSNILFALNYRLTVMPQADRLSWPVIQSCETEQGEEEAREMLHAFLDAQISQKPIKFMLLMGTDARNYLAPISNTSWQVIITHSLSHLLKNPHLKADVWRTIQPLYLHS